jgi:hypothetical protein
MCDLYKIYIDDLYVCIYICIHSFMYVCMMCMYDLYV